MQSTLRRAAFALVLSLLPTTPACAAIIATSGAVVVIAPPATTRSNQFESNTEIRAFPEQQNVELISPLALNITSPGVSPSGANQNLSPGSLPAGTFVNSYLLHFDAVGNSAINTIGLTGSLTLDADILGLIIQGADLNDSDFVPGLYPTITDYPRAEPARGLEITPGGVGQASNDEITLSPDRRTITVNLRTGTVQDQVRIITAVPEPATPATIAVAAALATCLRRRKSLPAD
jgi:hypothetical protein